MRALVIVVVVAALTSACAAAGARPQPFPGRRPPAQAPSVIGSPISALEPSAAATGYGVSGTALQFRGVPYRLGGTDPNGFDCSGLVWYVFAQHGLSLPRTVEDQFDVGDRVQPAELEPGDLVFFSTTSRGASHVGIVIGGDAFVHAPSSNGVVRVERLSASYWAQRFIGARRLF